MPIWRLAAVLFSLGKTRYKTALFSGVRRKPNLSYKTR
jgi:hypothetical protein